MQPTVQNPEMPNAAMNLHSEASPAVGRASARSNQGGPPPLGPAQPIAGTSKTNARIPATTWYVSVWLVCGLLSAVYLTAQIVNPDLIDSFFMPAGPGNALETNEGHRSQAKAVAEAKSATEQPSPKQPDTATAAKVDTKAPPTPKPGRTAETVGRVPAKSIDTIAADAIKLADKGLPKSVTDPQPPTVATNAVPDQNDTTSVAATVPKILNAKPAATTTVAQAQPADDIPQPPKLDDPQWDLSGAASTIETARVEQPETVKRPPEKPVAAKIAETATETTTQAPEKPASKKVDIPLPEKRGKIPAYALAQQRKTTDAKLADVKQPTEAQKNFQLAQSAPKNIETRTNVNTSISAFSTTTTAAGDDAGFTFDEPVITRADSAFGVALASGPSLDAIRLSWSLLSDNHAATLQNLSPRYTTKQTSYGESFRLLAGPLNTTSAAEAVCQKLRDRNIPCYTTAYKGNAL